jgi:ubiquinone biosynthesis protein UbiJ
MYAVFNAVALTVGRHLLRQAPWARARLAEHAGKQVLVRLPLGTILLRIGSGGGIDSGDVETQPALTVTLSPAAAAKWLVDREGAWRAARVQGDSDLAAAISYIVANLRWDYEEDLSRVIGDIAAHRIARGVQHLSAWRADTAQSLARNVSEYLSEERQVLATPLRMEEFSSEVDEIRDAAERLDKRIDSLVRRAGESSPQ